jgi:hypothetical protein
VEAVLLVADRPIDSRASLSTVAASTFDEPRTSPAMTTRLVVASVSQATRASGIAPRWASTTASEMRSQSLSGWPSDTDSEVKR